MESTLSTGKQTGSGLGLAISKHIVEAHGGNIRCKSKKGEGSVFSFTLHIIDKERQVYQKLKDELTKAKQQHISLSLLIFKISDFDDFTATYGAKACEDVLKMVKSNISKRGIKRTDEMVLFPPNGEMLLIMPDTDSAGAKIVRERIEKHLTNHEMALGDRVYRTAFTASAATFPEHGKSAEELADFARNDIQSKKYFMEGECDA